VPTSVVKTIRLRRSGALRNPNGHLEAQALNVYEDEDGVMRGDVLLMWVEGSP
jgi:hypothetical protein